MKIHDKIVNARKCTVGVDADVDSQPNAMDRHREIARWGKQVMRITRGVNKEPCYRGSKKLPPGVCGRYKSRALEEKRDWVIRRCRRRQS